MTVALKLRADGLIGAEFVTRLVLKAPKTESSVRDIFIPKYVAQTILEHKRKQKEWRESIGDMYTDFNLMLAQDNGYPIDTKYIEAAMRRLVAEHNLKPVVFHSLRHTSVSMKLSLCGDIKAVQGDTGALVCQEDFLLSCVNAEHYLYFPISLALI